MYSCRLVSMSSPSMTCLPRFLVGKLDISSSSSRLPLTVNTRSEWLILCLRGTRSRPIHLSLDFDRALAECRIAPAAWLLYQSWLLYRFLLLPSLFWIHFMYYICHYINNYFSPIKRYKGTTGNLGREQNSTRTKRCSEIIILQQIVLQAVTPVNYVTRAVSTALFCANILHVFDLR